MEYQASIRSSETCIHVDVAPLEPKPLESEGEPEALKGILKGEEEGYGCGDDIRMVVHLTVEDEVGGKG